MAAGVDRVEAVAAHEPGGRPGPRPARRRRWREATGACGSGASARRSRAEPDRPEAGACARRSASARRSAGESCVRGGRGPPGRRPPASRRADPRARGSRRRGSAASRAYEVECGSASHRRGLVSVSHAGCRGSALPRLRGEATAAPVGEVGGFSDADLPCAAARCSPRTLPTARSRRITLATTTTATGGAAFVHRRLDQLVAAFDTDRRLNRWLDVGCGAGTLMQAARGRGMGGDRDGGRRACGRGDARKGVRRQKRRARASSTCRRPRSTSSAASRSSSTCRT